MRDRKWSDQRDDCGAKLCPMAKSGVQRQKRVEEEGEEAPSLVPTELKTMMAIVFSWAAESLGRAHEKKSPRLRGRVTCNNAIDDLGRQRER